jgi:hypothetical protein
MYSESNCVDNNQVKLMIEAVNVWNWLSQGKTASYISFVSELN